MAKNKTNLEKLKTCRDCGEMDKDIIGLGASECQNCGKKTGNPAEIRGEQDKCLETSDQYGDTQICTLPDGHNGPHRGTGRTNGTYIHWD